MIKKLRNDAHFNSKRWLLYKEFMPELSQEQFETAVGMVLGDASVQNRGKHAHIKFEQGKEQKSFLYHLFEIFKQYTFMEFPGKRIDRKIKAKDNKIERTILEERNDTETVKSYWFKTFSHRSFTKICHLFYFDNAGIANNSCPACKKSSLLKTRGKKKSISFDLVNNFLTPRVFAYWVMCDGSLDRNKKILILHTQSFSFEENVLLTISLNRKFNLNCEVITDRKSVV